MKIKMTLALICILIFTLVASTVTAQTSMQRRAAEEAGESEESTETEASTTQETSSTQQASQPRRRSGEPETIRKGDDQDSVFQGYGVHMPGLRLDLGWGGEADITQVGVGFGYMYARGWEIVAFNEVQGVLRGGAGPDFTLLVDGNGFNGLAGFMTGRLHASATGAGGIGLEGSLGTGIGRGGFAPGLRLGVYYAGRYAEIGYFYQHTFLYRPSWMPPHNLGIRVHIPILKH